MGKQWKCPNCHSKRLMYMGSFFNCPYYCANWANCHGMWNKSEILTILASNATFGKGKGKLVPVVPWVPVPFPTLIPVTSLTDEIESAYTLGGLEAVLELEATLPQILAIKCECGSEKIGYNSHSYWCPKHKD